VTFQIDIPLEPIPAEFLSAPLTSSDPRPVKNILRLAMEPHRRVNPGGIYDLETAMFSKMKPVYTYTEGSGAVVDVKMTTLNGR